MPPSIRTFYVSLCVALLAALSLHVSAQAQHEVGHSSGWPPVSLVASDDHGHAHVHVAPTENEPVAPEQDQDGQPTGHHHSSVDKPVGSPSLNATGLPRRVGAVEHSFGPSRPLTDAGLSAPDQPPKRMRTIV